jgi:hypothetical protein
MICPECKSEYIEGIITCPDCNVPLVYHIQNDSVDNIRPESDHHFVCIYNPISSQEVSMIKMIMEREDIPYFIKNERLHGAVLFSILGPGKMALFVPEENAEKTIAILREELGHK